MFAKPQGKRSKIRQVHTPLLFTVSLTDKPQLAALSSETAINTGLGGGVPHQPQLVIYRFRSIETVSVWVQFAVSTLCFRPQELTRISEEAAGVSQIISSPQELAEQFRLDQEASILDQELEQAAAEEQEQQEQQRLQQSAEHGTSKPTLSRQVSLCFPIIRFSLKCFQFECEFEVFSSTEPL